MGLVKKHWLGFKVIFCRESNILKIIITMFFWCLFFFNFEHVSHTVVAFLLLTLSMYLLLALVLLYFDRFFDWPFKISFIWRIAFHEIFSWCDFHDVEYADRWFALSLLLSTNCRLQSIYFNCEHGIIMLQFVESI